MWLGHNKAQGAAGVLKRMSLAVVAMTGLLVFGSTTSASAAVVDKSAGSFTAITNVSGYQIMNLVENFDVNYDGTSDNGLYFWVAGKLPLRASVDHAKARYDAATRSAYFEGKGLYGTTPVYVKVSAAPYSSAYPGWYRISVAMFKADAFGNPLLTITGGMLQMAPTATVVAASSISFP